jgi:hypothetical protein
VQLSLARQFLTTLSVALSIVIAVLRPSFNPCRGLKSVPRSRRLPSDTGRFTTWPQVSLHHLTVNSLGFSPRTPSARSACVARLSGVFSAGFCMCTSELFTPSIRRWSIGPGNALIPRARAMTLAPITFRPFRCSVSDGAQEPFADTHLFGRIETFILEVVILHAGIRRGPQNRRPIQYSLAERHTVSSGALPVRSRFVSLAMSFRCIN